MGAIRRLKMRMIRCHMGLQNPYCGRVTKALQSAGIRRLKMRGVTALGVKTLKIIKGSTKDIKLFAEVSNER